MTNAEQSIADDKARAEIAHLNALTAQALANIEKMQTENKWYPLVIGSGATLAIVAIVKLFL